MILTIKTLQQSTFKVDIDPDRTVKELKEKILNEHGQEYTIEFQKLIYSGKILADDHKLAEYEIDEKKFIVLMVTRPPPKPKAAVVENKPTAAHAKPKDDAQKNNKQESGIAKTSNEQSKTLSSSSVSHTSSSSSTPSSAVIDANANTTAHTPRLDTTSVASGPAPTAHAPPSATATRTNNPVGSSHHMLTDHIASILDQPQFGQMRDLIQQSPHLLSSTIEALAASDPEMYNFISENPDAFIGALNHQPGFDSRTGSSATGGRHGVSHGNQSNQHASPVRNPSDRHQPEQILVNVNQHDKDAIERLKELGFSEYQAIQAYIACDKDEQLAANLLFQMDQ